MYAILYPISNSLSYIYTRTNAGIYRTLQSIHRTFSHTTTNGDETCPSYEHTPSDIALTIARAVLLPPSRAPPPVISSVISPVLPSSPWFHVIPFAVSYILPRGATIFSIPWPVPVFYSIALLCYWLATLYYPARAGTFSRARQVGCVVVCGASNLIIAWITFSAPFFIVYSLVNASVVGIASARCIMIDPIGHRDMVIVYAGGTLLCFPIVSQLGTTGVGALAVLHMSQSAADSVSRKKG